MMVYLKGLSREIDFKNVDKNLENLALLTDGRGWFLIFLGASMFFLCKKFIIIPVNASLRWLNNG
jgi:hypothetical protein